MLGSIRETTVIRQPHTIPLSQSEYDEVFAYQQRLRGKTLDELVRTLGMGYKGLEFAPSGWKFNRTYLITALSCQRFGEAKIERFHLG